MYNQNSGYGLATALGFPPSSPIGRVFIVGSSTVVGRQLAEMLYKIDPEGKLRLVDDIAEAIALTTAGRGDRIYVLPGHAETLTAAIAVSVQGVEVIGLGRGSLKPTITVNGTVDGFNMSGADTKLENIHFAAPETDEATAAINIAAAGVHLKDITGIGSKTSKNFVDMITVAAGADDLFLENVRFHNTTVAVNSFLNIEAAVARFRIKGFFAFGDVATAGIIDAATATQIAWEDVDVAVVGSSKPAATLDSNPTGFIKRANFAGTSTTLATNAALGTGVRLFDVKVLEETGGAAQGALIPAVDAD